MNKGFSLPVIVIGMLLLIGVLGGGAYYLGSQNSKTTHPPQQKACTEEAKQCPDGSYVSRVNPNCEFVSCPTFRPISSFSPAPVVSNFNFIFKYGVGAKNELDTFKGNYTKDMITESPITTKILLTNEELDRIYQKMAEINFFDYPEKFSVTVSPKEFISAVTPYSSYYIKVNYKGKIKELQWDDEIQNKDEDADKLRSLIQLIKNIIESTDEYKKLPQANGGYL